MKKIFLLLLLPAQVVFAQNKDVITATPNLIVQGIPDIPLSIKNDLLRYTESRAAGFTDWHPVKRNMLISTRFANVPQLHLVKTPLGARKQITFYEDAVTSGTYDPVNGEYFLFNKDIGGNEFSQIYRYDVATGNVTMITDGGRSQNGGITWSDNGKWIAYGSTRRNGADRDIYIMDPKNPSSDKIALQVTGGGWGVLDWSGDNKKL